MKGINNQTQTSYAGVAYNLAKTASKAVGAIGGSIAGLATGLIAEVQWQKASYIPNVKANSAAAEATPLSEQAAYKAVTQPRTLHLSAGSARGYNGATGNKRSKRSGSRSDGGLSSCSRWTQVEYDLGACKSKGTLVRYDPSTVKINSEGQFADRMTGKTYEVEVGFFWKHVPNSVYGSHGRDHCRDYWLEGVAISWKRDGNDPSPSPGPSPGPGNGGNQGDTGKDGGGKGNADGGEGVASLNEVIIPGRKATAFASLEGRTIALPVQSRARLARAEAAAIKKVAEVDYSSAATTAVQTALTQTEPASAYDHTIGTIDIGTKVATESTTRTAAFDQAAITDNMVSDIFGSGNDLSDTVGLAREYSIDDGVGRLAAIREEWDQEADKTDGLVDTLFGNKDSKDNGVVPLELLMARGEAELVRPGRTIV